MRKIFALAALVLGVVSCQTEPEGFDATVGGEVDTVISIAIPEAETRAGGLDSAVGAFENKVLDGDLTMRYICEVHYGTKKKTLDPQYSDGKTVQFPVRLIPNREYRFVVWADIVNETAKADIHYYTAGGLENITLNDTWVAMDETRDAYFCSEKCEFTGNGEISLTLKRPFAKVRVITTDMAELLGVVPAYAKVEYTTPYYSKFNAKTGEVATEGYEKDHEFAIATYGDDTENVSKVLFTDYFFATADQKAVQFVLSVYEDDSWAENKLIKTNSFNTDIPVKRNYLTTIQGNILTTGDNITVTIDDKFAQPEFEYTVEEDPATGVVSAVAKTVDGLVAISTMINNGELAANTNISLGGDIDLSDNTYTRSLVSNWAPIGTSENPFTGTFDGRGYSIKNLVLVEDEAKEGKAYIGFFGYAKNVAIKNVTFENVHINIPCLDIDHSQGHIGAVAGSLEGTSTIENVTVKGDIKVYATQNANGASRVAVVAGGNTYGDVTMKNVHVIANEGSYLTANNNTGALAGQLQGKMVFENCSSNINVTVNKFFAGGLVGIAAGDSTFTNCHTTGDVAVVAGREGRHNDEYRVGGIAGGWADGKTKVCTLVNCSYTGKVSGKNADGAVAEPLDYFGYVGRGYTLANCEGSKVVIDGTEFVQVGNAAPYGIYTINGCTPVSTADELVAALEANEGVYLLNDITVAATKGGYNKAGILQNKAQTIDGGGHTLTVTGAGATWDCAIYTNGGVIRNLTVAGAMRGIFTAGQSSDLNIENVVFKNVIYTFNSDGKMPANPFGVYVSNSALNGWTSHSDMHTEVVYTNCSFGEGSGYKYCRPYGKTAFVNCTFCPGFSIDKSRTTDLTFTNCIFEE